MSFSPKSLGISLILFFVLSAQAQPALHIVSGAEHQPGFPGLAGLRPHGSDRRSMTIALVNGSRVLAFNLEVVNLGNQPFDPQAVRPDLVYYDWWSHGTALMGFWRFSLYDTNGVLIPGARRTQDARFVVWDHLAWDGTASPMTFGPWANPGISPGRVAFVTEPFTGWSYVPFNFDGPCTLVVETDPFGAWGVHDQAQIDIDVHRFQVKLR